MMVNIYFVHSSPLQLICAAESCLEFSENRNDKNIIISTFVKGSLSETQLMNTLNLIKVDQHINYNPQNFFDRLTRYFYLKKILVNYSNVRIFTGMTGSHLVSFAVDVLKKRKILDKVILFDEGTHLLFAMDKILHNKDNIDFKYSFIKKMIKRFFLGSDFENIIPDVIFTSYFLKSYHPKIQENHFKNLKSKIVGFDKSNEVFFLGQPLTLKEVSEDDYLNFMSKILEKFKRVKYIIHRYEPKEILEKLKKIPGIELLKIEDCIEYYFVKERKLPRQVIGFSTSALLSLEKIFQDQCSFLSIEIPSSFINIDYRERMSKIYSKFKDGPKIVVQSIETI